VAPSPWRPGTYRPSASSAALCHTSEQSVPCLTFVGYGRAAIDVRVAKASTDVRLGCFDVARLMVIGSPGHDEVPMRRRAGRLGVGVALVDVKQARGVDADDVEQDVRQAELGGHRGDGDAGDADGSPHHS
jgi:hypothetical protein